MYLFDSSHFNIMFQYFFIFLEFIFFFIHKKYKLSFFECGHYNGHAEHIVYDMNA